MRRVFACFGFAASIAATTAPAAARALEPASQWILDYGDERCSLMRDFGSGNDSLRMQLDSYGRWNSFRMLLVGKAVPSSSRPTGEARFSYSADVQQREKTFAILGASDKLPAVSFGLGFTPYVLPSAVEALPEEERTRLSQQMSRPHPEFDRQIETITVEFHRGTPVELKVGNMEQPLAALRACVDDLHKSWGIDPELQKSLSRTAEPLPSTVKRVQREYPAAPMVKGVSAVVPVRLLIDATGRARSCVVQITSVDEPFKEAVCENLAADFEPALDPHGMPVESMYNTSVFYLVGG
jgi:hypothetical protein